MVRMGAPWAVAALIAIVFAPGTAQSQLACGRFTTAPVAAPAPRTARWAVHRFEQINAAVKTEPYRVLFLGDSLTEGFDAALWQSELKPRGVLNAGVSGDRTEHLRWRLQHGNLAGPPPQGVVVLIGTNDLTGGGHPRAPAVVAEGIRANLLYLRRRLPDARILLLGLWPREAFAEARLRQGTVAVNRLIRQCGDDAAVTYADIGGVLLDPDGRLGRDISPDLLHFSPAGYARLVPKLDPLIDALLTGR